jgi:hypothetical protein
LAVSVTTVFGGYDTLLEVQVERQSIPSGAVTTRPWPLLVSPSRTNPDPPGEELPHPAEST